jgi:biopolymer transport protein ExbB
MNLSSTQATKEHGPISIILSHLWRSSRVIQALNGPSGWILILLSMAVLTVTFERLHFWLRWWRRRNTRQRHWLEAMDQGERHARAWIDDRDREMGFGQTFLEAAIVIAPLLGLIGTVLGLSHLLSAMGPQWLPSERQDLPGFGEILLCTAVGLTVSLLATITWHINNGLRQWHLGLWARDLARGGLLLENR